MASPGLFAWPALIAAAEPRFIVAERLVWIGLSADIILEPQGCDWAAAVAVAPLHAARIDLKAIVLTLAALSRHR